MSSDKIRFECTNCFQRIVKLSNSVESFSITASWKQVSIDFSKNLAPEKGKDGGYINISLTLINDSVKEFHDMNWPDTSLNWPEDIELDVALEKKIIRIFNGKSYESGYSDEMTKKFNKLGFEVVTDLYIIHAKEKHQKLEIVNATKDTHQGPKSLDVVENDNLIISRILKPTKSIDKITSKENILAAIYSPEYDSFSELDEWLQIELNQFLALQYIDGSVDSWNEFFVDVYFLMKEEDQFKRCLFKLEPITIPPPEFNQNMQFRPLFNMVKIDFEGWREVNSQKAKRFICEVNLYQ